MWGTLPVTLGDKWSSRPTPTNPGARIATGRDLFLLIITCTSHRRHRRWIIPVYPYPWRREAMFVYIDWQHMWHSCCWRRQALAEVCLCFPLATVQLAGKTASSVHLTNQYKQWSSKSRITLEQTEMRERIKLLIIWCSEMILFWDRVKCVFKMLNCALCFFPLCARSNDFLGLFDSRICVFSSRLWEESQYLSFCSIKT